jgi:chemotaxis response regulator CheB
MPESAIASGCIDFVLSPEDIAQEIIHLCTGTPKPHRVEIERRNNVTG